MPEGEPNTGMDDDALEVAFKAMQKDGECGTNHLGNIKFEDLSAGEKDLLRRSEELLVASVQKQDDGQMEQFLAELAALESAVDTENEPDNSNPDLYQFLRNKVMIAGLNLKGRNEFK